MSLNKYNPLTKELTPIAGGFDVEGILENIGDLTDLETTDKSSLVDAINEVNSGKVDKVAGKGLSTNDYDNTEKGKVADNASAIEAIVNKYGSCNIWKNTWETHTKLGITFTKNTDGTITLSGISTEPFDEYITPFKITKGSYIFSSGVPTSVYHQKGVGIVSGTLGYSVIGEREEHTFSDDTNFGAYLHFESGVDLTTPIIFKPMIHDARLNPSGYVPYAMTNRELTERTEKSIEYSGALNNLLKPGFYITASGVTNTPNDSDYHFINNGLFVSGNGVNYCSQMIIDTRNQLFSRVCNDGVWSSWEAYAKL